MKKPNLNLDDWVERSEKTPAGGIVFYNKELNQVAVQYSGKIKVYCDPRNDKNIMYPCDYNESQIFMME